MDYFNDCTALITGASSGIGRELALQLAPHASNLILVARRLDRVEALKAEIAVLNPEVSVFPYGLDLADELALDTFLHWIGKTGLDVDLLINNAGLGDHGPFADSNWDRVRRILDVNIAALTKLTWRLLPEMLEKDCGAILNVSSVASFLPVPYLAVYAASKAYVTSFSEALRAELRDTGISVTTLCPGPVPTEFGQHAARRGEGQAFEVQTPSLLVVDAATVAAEGLRAVARDRARVVPGWTMFAATLALSLIPFFVVRFFLDARARELRQN